MEPIKGPKYHYFYWVFSFCLSHVLTLLYSISLYQFFPLSTLRGARQKTIIVPMALTITKRDGTKVPFNADRINKSIERACYGISDPISKVIQIATETQLTLYDGITTEEMDLATINAALQNSQFGLEFDKIATRLLLKVIYKKVIGDYDPDEREITNEEFKRLHNSRFKDYILNAVERGLLDQRMATTFNLEELSSY